MSRTSQNFAAAGAANRETIRADAERLRGEAMRRLAAGLGRWIGSAVAGLFAGRGGRCRAV